VTVLTFDVAALARHYVDRHGRKAVGVARSALMPDPASTPDATVQALIDGINALLNRPSDVSVIDFGTHRRRRLAAHKGWFARAGLRTMPRD
jgi:hypothetical protein